MVKYTFSAFFETWRDFPDKNGFNLCVSYDDAIPMFKSDNRYRDVLANPEGNTLYVLTDTEGNVQKVDGPVTNTLENPGSLIKFTYNR